MHWSSINSCGNLVLGEKGTKRERCEDNATIPYPRRRAVPFCQSILLLPQVGWREGDAIKKARLLSAQRYHLRYVLRYVSDCRSDNTQYLIQRLHRSISDTMSHWNWSIRRESILCELSALDAWYYQNTTDQKYWISYLQDPVMSVNNGSV